MCSDIHIMKNIVIDATEIGKMHSIMPNLHPVFAYLLAPKSL